MKKTILFLIISMGVSGGIVTSKSLADEKAVSFEFNKTSYWDDFKFSKIPILHSGRVKPLSTFAREYLLVLHEKSSLSDMSAEQWLAEVLFDPQFSSKRPVFKIRNPEIIDLLNLKRNKKNLYSFNELSESLDQTIEQLNEIKNKPENDRSLLERQLLDLYVKVLSYFQLRQSLALILPLFSLKSPALSEALNINPNKNYSYLEIIRFQQKINSRIRKLKTKHFKNLSKENQQLISLSYKMNILSKNEANDLFRIIPPQWSEDKDLWYSPWTLIGKGKGSPLSASYLENWIQMEEAYRTKQNWKTATNATYKKAMEISKGFASPALLYLEKIFNDIQFFQKSLVFYILAFLLLALSSVFWKSALYRLSFAALTLGFILHLIGVLFRIVIMGRPPVSTLYESILFVGWVSVGLTLWLEKHKREGMGLLIGSLAGAGLHFIGFKYKGAEAMSLLVPVLNTNFWLATHVTCITIGYGCAIVTSLMGHVYILVKCLQKRSLRLKTRLNFDLPGLYKNMISASFIALFFCLFGTILGGIWADQSWGRFWGWDPKENGALAIVIWLLVLIHGRLAGILQDNEYAAGMMLTNVIVALSWFGVNLLNIGLHSYGFTSGALWGLTGFCTAELLITFTAYFYLKINYKSI